MANEIKLKRQRYEKLLSSFLVELEHTKVTGHAGEPDLALALIRDAWHANVSDFHINPELDGFTIRLFVQKSMEQQMRQLGVRDEQIKAIGNRLEKITGLFLSAKDFRLRFV